MNTGTKAKSQARKASAVHWTPGLFIGYEEEKKGRLGVFKMLAKESYLFMAEAAALANPGVLIVYEHGHQSKFYVMARSRLGEIFVLATDSGIPEDCRSLHSAIGTAVDGLFDGCYFGLVDDGLLGTDIEVIQLQHAFFRPLEVGGRSAFP
jgi:hypothetical protein